ncbi:MAG TPA: aconitase X catalytic domain-containing protein [Nitrososphaerales archaeon]|nr:aconitase X catalytic domain-containing protein [Nitrososphaerales archaeon]
MHLDSSQERALRGEEGDAKRLAMEILAKVGDAVSADSLVPIKSAHVLAHYSSLHEAGIEVLERFASSGGRFMVPTTVDPASVDLDNWKSFEVPEEYAEKQFRLCAAYAKLGGIPCWTCVQYQVSNFPRSGETVAWAESSSVVFANSLIGCRTNKIMSGLDLACAMTGLTPRYGMLLDENRTARISFKLSAGALDDLDLRTAGFFIGRNSGSRVPALENLPPDVTSDELKHLGASAAAAGPVTMIHYLGLTPGSEDLMSATAGERVERIEIERKDLEETRAELNQTDETPDLIAFGVPHLSASEIGQLAKRLKGRRLKSGVKMYVYTSSQGYEMAQLSGAKEELESSGARLTHTTDAEISPLKRMGFDVVLTNSAKMAEIVASEGDVKMRYASTASIVEEMTD